MEQRTKRHPTSNISGRPPKTFRPLSHHYIHEVYQYGSRRISSMSSLEIFILSLFGGGFMTVAALLSALLTAGVTSNGVEYVVIGLGLSVGLFFVLLTNSVLFTESNIFVPTNFYAPLMSSVLRVLRFWLWSWLGNIIGALIVGYLIYLAETFPPFFPNELGDILIPKLVHHKIDKFHGTGELLISGMLSNWLISLAMIFAFTSRNILSKYIPILLVSILVAATGFQFFPFNVGYFALLIITTKGFFWWWVPLLFWNLIPVCIGNVVGAAFLVGWPMLYFSKRR